MKNELYIPKIMSNIFLYVSTLIKTQFPIVGSLTRPSDINCVRCYEDFEGQQGKVS